MRGKVRPSVRLGLPYFNNRLTLRSSGAMPTLNPPEVCLLFSSFFFLHLTLTACANPCRWRRPQWKLCRCVSRTRRLSCSPSRGYRFSKARPFRLHSAFPCGSLTLLQVSHRGKPTSLSSASPPLHRRRGQGCILWLP
jgi:hypothetical protein